MKCCLWNVHSLNRKLPSIMEHVLDHNPDVIFLTETWLQDEKNALTAEVKTYGYRLLHNPRKDREKERGGGVGIMVRSSITAKQLAIKHFKSFEHTVVRLFLANKERMILISIYRVLFAPIPLFLEELSDLLDKYALSKDSLTIAGDLNLHMESNCPYAKQLSELLDVYNLKQHILEPTHIKGNILDLVITENRDNYFQDAIISKLDVSDHFLVSFSLATKLEACKSKRIKYRSIKKVDVDQFNNMVVTRLDALPFTNNLKAKVSSYNAALEKLVDEVAPVKTKVIKLVPNAPWFDEEYANIRKLRRKAEKRYRKTELERHKVEYMILKKEAIKSAFEKKKIFISKRLEEDSGKSLHKIVNELTDNKKETILPTGKTDKQLANNFLIYFKDKIEKIRNKFKHSSSEQNHSTNPMLSKMSEFEPATLEEIIKIAKSYGVKCSPEDPVPASLLSSCIETFAPYWLEIVNLSLELGDMDGLKNAVLIPLIKELNSTVDIENYKNYRPVSNLLFVSKLIERIVQIRLERHMLRNGLENDKNYAYTKNHSTEHLLLKVVNDLYIAFDQSKPTVVVLLDLSAAFDTVDHAKLLYILEHEIGIVGTSLRWFESFLKGRSQKVKIGEEYSEILELLCCVA